jgi:hypothetical protein
VLDQVITFLFPTGERVGCAYPRVTGEATQTWFQRTEVELSSGARRPVELVPEPRIEVFLSGDGVGVLSLALTPGPPGLPADEALDYNYRLAQCQPWAVRAVEIPAPNLANVPPAALGSVQKPPAPGDPLAERMTRRGDKYTLVELIDELLAPLRADEALRFRAVQPMLSVYTVALFGPEVDLGRADVRDRLAPFLSALVQIEEPGHAGASEVAVAHALLNRRHWAAVGQLGAAHLIADQPPPPGQEEHPYNRSRLPRVRDKYFIPYLMALLQRLVLHRSIETASTVLKAKGRRRGHDLARFRENLLRFAVDGHFNEVSTREVLHRYYGVAQQGLDAPTAWEEIRLAIAELHAWESEARQRRLVRKVSRNVRHTAKFKRFVHMTEYFLVSVYFAHLWHMFAEGNRGFEQWVSRHLPLREDWVVSVGVVVFAVLGLVFVWLINRLMGRHKGRKRRPAGPGAIPARGR